MDQCTRRLVGFGVQGGALTGADVCRLFNVAIRGHGTPRHLSTDHRFGGRVCSTACCSGMGVTWNASSPSVQDYYNTVHGDASLNGKTPLGFGEGKVTAPADLNRVRWVSHCCGLVQLPVAA